jgi:hypothetical protein
MAIGIGMSLGEKGGFGAGIWRKSGTYVNFALWHGPCNYSFKKANHWPGENHEKRVSKDRGKRWRGRKAAPLDNGLGIRGFSHINFFHFSTIRVDRFPGRKS